jgi:uncharacterized protein DUF4956
MPPDLNSWLETSDAAATGESLGRYAARLGASIVVGLVISQAYRASTQRAESEVSRLAKTLVMLTVLVAMTALVVDNSVARAFSLVGALAIVRFRTIVEDTRDTAFVIFAVVSGMTLGVGNWTLCLVGVPLVTAVALLHGRSAAGGGAAASGPIRQLSIRLGGGRDPEAVLSEALRRHSTSYRLTRTTTARQGAALELTFAVTLRADAKPIALVQELNGLDGVQQVELSES